LRYFDRFSQPLWAEKEKIEKMFEKPLDKLEHPLYI